MRARLDEIVGANLGRSAVPAITTYEFGTATAVVEAAETSGRPVAVLVPTTRFVSAGGRELVRALRALADNASIPVSVQLDHATETAVILSAVEAGVDAVLADGSKSGLQENAEFVREIVAATAGANVAVEAELGAIAGHEDRSVGSTASGFTDPAVVADFLTRSGAQLLAVSVGNVHGAYKGQPQLRWDLIEQLEAVSTVPLVLHGASGIPRSDMRRAVQHAFGKVNINTELRAVLFRAMTSNMDRARENGDDLLGFGRTLHSAARSFTNEVLADLDLASENDTART